MNSNWQDNFIWVHDDDGYEKYIPVEKAVKYFEYGWHLGRLRDKCKCCEKYFNKDHCTNHEIRCCNKLFTRLRRNK